MFFYGGRILRSLHSTLLDIKFLKRLLYLHIDVILTVKIYKITFMPCTIRKQNDCCGTFVGQLSCYYLHMRTKRNLVWNRKLDIFAN